MGFTKETVTGFISELEKKDYVKYIQGINNEDYGYWKRFGKCKDKYNESSFKYQVAFLFYDFSKYSAFNGDLPIGIQCEFILHETEEVSILNMSLSEDKCTIEDFEELCSDFYKKICVKFIKKMKK